MRGSLMAENLQRASGRSSALRGDIHGFGGLQGKTHTPKTRGQVPSLYDVHETPWCLVVTTSFKGAGSSSGF